MINFPYDFRTPEEIALDRRRDEHEDDNCLDECPLCQELSE